MKRSVALKRLLSTRNLIILLLVIALFVVSSLLNLGVALPVISIAPEVIVHIGSFPITNSLLTSWLVVILAVVLGLAATRDVPKNLETATNQDLVPKGGFQNLVEWMIEGFYGLTREVAGGRWAPKFFPITMTIFIFVLLANWAGLIPGFGSIGWLHHPHGEEAGHLANGPFLMKQEAAAGEGYVVTPFLRSPSADLNFTLALALMAVVPVAVLGASDPTAGLFQPLLRFLRLQAGRRDGSHPVLCRDPRVDFRARPYSLL